MPLLPGTNVRKAPQLAPSAFGGEQIRQPTGDTTVRESPPPPPSSPAPSLGCPPTNSIPSQGARSQSPDGGAGFAFPAEIHPQISTLPSCPEVWVGTEPSVLATELAYLLTESLHLDLAFMRLCDSERRQTVIEDRKRAEEKIREQEAELRQILDLAPQLVALLGPQGERLFANRVLLEIFGLTFEEWRNRPFPSLSSLHPDDRERFARVFETGLDRGAPTAFEVRVRSMDGTFRWFLFHQNPLRDDHGRMTRWYLVGTDIDDRKMAEHTLQQENIALREEIDKTSMFEEIVGASPPLRAVLSHVAKVAPTDSTVLITGETGTGKELIARAIHKRSPRSARAFVAVNCAAIPSSLIASELFGHEKGAFTGALQRRQGRFELADGGTIFLDEVAELPAETQIMLLRVLQEREFERVGGTGPVRVYVRVIAATNRDLHAAVAEGTFRADLFYRLNVFPLHVPALRDRRSDVPLLVEYFTHRYTKRLGKRIRRLTHQTSTLLQSYDWPGNIRELQNVLERAVIVCESDTLSIDPRWLSGRSIGTAPVPSPSTGALATHEKDAIEAALTRSQGRVAGPFGAAGRLGVPASTLESKIKMLQIDKRRFKPG